MKHKPTPARDYPPGYFTELIRAANWPPRFEPSMFYDAAAAQRYRAAQIGREISRENGQGWGATGTCPMPGTPNNLAPGWIGVRP